MHQLHCPFAGYFEYHLKNRLTTNFQDKCQIDQDGGALPSTMKTRLPALCGTEYRPITEN
jgi:hypothetical protein